MQPVEWLGDRLRIIDQTLLPGRMVHLELSDYHDVISAIKELRVRGAPAIGIAAAYGIALGALALPVKSRDDFITKLNEIMQSFAAARPTAVNLFYAINRMKEATTSQPVLGLVKDALVNEAQKIHAEEETASEQLSKFGAALIKDSFTILTHCNAGPLATGGYGTALGVIRAARAQGKEIRVIATETRPLFQGARLTTWELVQENIPTTLITDSMAGTVLHQGMVNCVIVGADRIAANGDTANKIGTYTLAVLAFENKVPFYVAAPLSTVDFSIKSGAEIPIEERNPEEITSIAGKCIAPEGINVYNPAFDITPYRYITAIITEKGIATKPYSNRLVSLFK